MMYRIEGIISAEHKSNEADFKIIELSPTIPTGWVVVKYIAPTVPIAINIEGVISLPISLIMSEVIVSIERIIA